jgi:antibiotic biosynthesis monooxygenase (ABM) superfamily enzyme
MTPASASPEVPAAPRLSRPHLALLVSLGAYPLITGLIYAIFPLTEGWMLWQRTLVIVPIMVSAMIWGLIPAVHRHFRGFINR